MRKSTSAGTAAGKKATQKKIALKPEKKPSKPKKQKRVATVDETVQDSTESFIDTATKNAAGAEALIIEEEDDAFAPEEQTESAAEPVVAERAQEPYVIPTRALTIRGKLNVGYEDVNVDATQLPSGHVLAATRMATVGMDSLRSYFGYGGTKPWQAHGENCVAEVLASNHPGFTEGDFLATCEPVGIVGHFIVNADHCIKTKSPRAGLLSATQAYAELCAKKAQDEYVKTNGNSARRILVIGRTAVADGIASMVPSARLFPAGKFSLLAGEQFDLVFDARGNSDVINASKLVAPYGMHVQCISGWRGDGNVPFHQDIGNDESILCLRPSMLDESFHERWLVAQNKPSAAVEQHLRKCSFTDVYAAFGAPGMHVRVDMLV